MHGRGFMKFSGYIGQDTGNNLKNLGVVCLNPCIQGLWATLRKNGWTDSHEIFRKVRTWDKEQSGIFSTCSGFSFFSICVYHQHYGITDGWIFMTFSGYGPKKELAILFHAWLECFAFLKQGAAEVCAVGVLRVLYVYRSFIPNKATFTKYCPT